MRLSILPHYFGIKGYRVIIADFPMEYFMGEGFIPISKSKIRWLILSQLKAVQNYLSKANSLQKEHKSNQKIHQIEKN